MDLGIFEGSVLTIENIDSSTKASFVGEFGDSDEKHGYDEKITIYGVTKLKYSALINKGSVEINFIDETNRDIIRGFFKYQTKINVVDQDEVTYNGFNIIGNELKFTPSYEVEGEKFYSANFEVKR